MQILERFSILQSMIWNPNVCKTFIAPQYSSMTGVFCVRWFIYQLGNVQVGFAREFSGVYG